MFIKAFIDVFASSKAVVGCDCDVRIWKTVEDLWPAGHPLQAARRPAASIDWPDGDTSHA